VVFYLVLHEEKEELKLELVTHLHLHSEYSLQDSLLKIEQFPEFIKKKNVRAIAVTDHGTVDGAIKFYQKTKDVMVLDKAGEEVHFRPMLGCEFYVVDDHTEKANNQRWHLVVIAKNLKGFQSIMRALTVANLEGFYYKPRISWDYILEKMSDVIILTACHSGMLMRDDCLEKVDAFQKRFGRDFYLEAILLEDYEPQILLNELACVIGKSKGIEVAFTNDVHIVEEEDWPAKSVCTALSWGEKRDPKTYKDKPEDLTTDFYVKSYEQMVKGLKHFGLESYKESMSKVWDQISEECDARQWFDHPMIPTVPVPREITGNKNEHLMKVCYDAFDKFKGTGDREVARARMEHELLEICQLGFAEYFLLVMDLCQWAKSNDIMVGAGRGSVGGSFVAYLLKITGVNPLDYDLVFERFISPGRHDLPDIDLDFEDVKKEQILEYLTERYGQPGMEHNVALVSTHAAMKGRGALRDVSRVFDVPLAAVNDAAKQILVRSGGDARASFSIEDTISLFDVSSKFAKDYPYVIDEAKKLEGLMKNKGIHAAGIVVDTNDLADGTKCVLIRAKQGDVAVNWDKKDLEYMGLMKLDVLALKTLNVLNIIQHLVKKNHSVDIVWEDLVPLDDGVGYGDREADPEVIKRFKLGDSIGTFQFGSTGMIQYLRDFQPENFKELYQVNALYRPGTLRSGMANKFIRLKKGDTDEVPDYINDELKNILEPTYGIVLFQEQIMYIFNRLGDIPWRTADTIRKVVSKSEGADKFETFRAQFLRGVEKLKSMSQEDAGKIFNLMKFFGSYGFNKCISSTTRILVPASGSMRKSAKRISISQAYKQGCDEVFIYDSASKKQRIASVSEIVNCGRKKVYEVTCRTNRERKIETTIDHKFLTPIGWRKLSDLSVGDKVMVKAPNTILYGKNNPMYKKGDYISECMIKSGAPGKISQAMKGKALSENHKKKLRIAARVRTVHGHTGFRHSDETKEKIRQKTLQQIKNGLMPQTLTGIHSKVIDHMKLNNLWEGFEVEYRIKNRYSIDIADPIHKIAIECQGDYWHANPKFYCEKNQTQIRNVSRDKQKRKLLHNEGWDLICLWGDDIKNNINFCIEQVRGAVSDSMGNPWEYAKIESIIYAGEKETYDIHVDDSEHNYIANMFVVHNSHSVEYTILGYWTMWAKVHYPLEFYCATLMREADKEDIAMLISEFGRTGAQVKSPDINKSDITWSIESTEGAGTLRSGFDVIRGISARLSAEMIRCRELVGGEFESFEHFYSNVPKRLVNIARVKALLLADVFTEMLTEDQRKKMVIHIEQKKKVPKSLEDLEEIDAGEYESLDAVKQEVFSYELPEAFLNQNNTFLDLTIRKNYKDIVPLAIMKEIKEGSLMGDRWFIGKFDEIKYGYRTAIDKKKTTVDTAGYADDLGGVYGIFRDNTYLYYTTFGKNVYNPKADLKGKIEGAAGKYILIKAGKPMKTTNLFVQEIYFIDDVKRGEFYKGKDWGLDLAGVVAETVNRGVLEDLKKPIRECTECYAYKNCTQPVPFSHGDFQAMIIGMDPGRDEDQAGIPFIGSSGKSVWDALGMEREYFHVTNIQKCQHKGDWDNFTAKVCAERWLRKEIEIVKPKLILSLGSQALQWLTGDRKALIFRRLGMEDSSSDIGQCVEWSKSLEAWIMYALHPSWALHCGRITDWKESIKHFSKMFARLV